MTWLGSAISCGGVAKYQVEFTGDARDDLLWFEPFDRKIILEAIKTQLENEPMLETRNRKRLRENPLGPWELRAGKDRVFYQVDADSRVVTVGAIGYKEHNKLYIRGTEVTI